MSLARYRAEKRARSRHTQQFWNDHDKANHIDTFVWYALAERLHRKGYWVSCMIDHALPRCPHCHGRAKFQRGARLIAYCVSSGEHGMIHDDLLERITEIYNSAFDEPIEEPQLIR